MLRLLKSSRGFFLSYLKIKRLPYIQIGSEVVVKEYPDRREYAVWEEVLNACLKEKYIERKSEAIFSSFGEHCICYIRHFFLGSYFPQPSQVCGQLIFHSKYSSLVISPKFSSSFLRTHSFIKSFRTP